MRIASLFILHVATNSGYAIAPLERLFYEIGLELADNDPRFIHFAYPSLDRGHPNVLPPSFENVFRFSVQDKSPTNLARLGEYAGRHRIRLAMIFDIQPVHPLFRSLRRSGVSTILSYWGAPVSSPMPIWRLALKKLQLATSRSRLDGLVFESHAMADLAIRGLGVPPGAIDIVPLGVDTTLFQPGRSEYAYDAIGLPRDRKVVIYVGHMERRKGVHTFIEAAVELLYRRRRVDVCFVLFGNKGDQSREYERMYQGLGIEALIRFCGYRSDLPDIYPGCLCGVIPSTGWDSFPRSALEMAASGLPVVASRLQGLPEAVLDQQTGLLFEPGNAMELVACLERLLDQPDLAAELGNRGRRRCEQELNLSLQRERLLAVVRRRLACTR